MNESGFFHKIYENVFGNVHVDEILAGKIEQNAKKFYNESVKWESAAKTMEGEGMLDHESAKAYRDHSKGQREKYDNAVKYKADVKEGGMGKYRESTKITNENGEQTGFLGSYGDLLSGYLNGTDHLNNTKLTVSEFEKIKQQRAVAVGAVAGVGATAAIGGTMYLGGKALGGRRRD